jgi:hypothetical protein
MPGGVFLVCKKWPKIAKIPPILPQKAPKGHFLTIFCPKMAKNYRLNALWRDFSLYPPPEISANKLTKWRKITD